MSEPCSDCTVEEIHQKREAGGEVFVIDVRTPQELDIAKLEWALHIPMDEIETRLHELEHRRDEEIVVMCHLGGRSAMVQDFLIQSGFKNVRNLIGGIEAYACRVDKSLGRY